jgi:Cro/C1-type HTH DNA-binding domain
MVHKLNFHWNLRQLMAAHEIWKTTELIPLLAQRGVTLSVAQVYGWSPTSPSGCR